MNRDHKIIRTIFYLFICASFVIFPLSQGEENLHLDLVVDNKIISENVEFRILNNRWYARKSDLEMVAIDWSTQETELVALDDLPNLQWQYFKDDRRVELTLGPTRANAHPYATHKSASEIVTNTPASTQLTSSATDYTPKAPDDSTALPDERLYLEAVINAKSMHVVLEIKTEAGQWMALREELESFKLNWTLPDGDWIALDDLPESEWEYIAPTQRLHLNVAPRFLPLQDFTYKPNVKPLAQRDIGAYLNYSFFHNHSNTKKSSTSLWHTLNFFTPLTYWTSSGIYQKNQTNYDDYIRLDSQVKIDLEATRMGIQIGDVFNDGREYLNSYRVGGIRIARDFSLDPSKIYFPLPEFLGEAELPSSLDIWLNNQRLQSIGIESGPYKLPLGQSLGGFNSATIVTTDIQGRPTTQNLNFYVSSNLLRKGLLDYDFSSGNIRNNYGLESFDYDDKVLSTARLSYGVSNNFTGELFGQNVQSRSNMGGGLRLGLGNFGILNGSYAQSHTNDISNDATQISYGYEFFRYGFGVYGNHQKREENYADLVTSQFSNNLKQQTTIGISQNFNDFGQFNFNFIKRNYWQDPVLPIFEEYPNEPAFPSLNFFGSIEIKQLSWYKSLGTKGMLSARWQQYKPMKNDSFSLGLTYYFGSRNSASIQSQTNDDETTTYANISRSTSYPYGVGWNISTSDAANGTHYADVRVRNPRGTGAIRYADNTRYKTTSAEWNGSIVLMDSDIFFASTIYDAFAVVDTNFSNIPIYSGYQKFGESSNRGKYLIPDIAGYLDNQIRIDPMDLPENIYIDEPTRVIRAKRGGGVLIDFDVRLVTQVRTKAYLPNNEPLPAGTTLLNDKGESIWVGWDGELFIESTTSHEKWYWEDGDCYLQLPPLSEGDSNYLEPLVCSANSPVTEKQP